MQSVAGNWPWPVGDANGGSSGFANVHPKWVSSASSGRVFCDIHSKRGNDKRQIEPWPLGWKLAPHSHLPGRVNDRQPDYILQTLQVAHHEASVRPRARVADVQVVAVRL